MEIGACLAQNVLILQITVKLEAYDYLHCKVRKKIKVGFILRK